MKVFRRARPAATSWNAAKTLAQVIAFWGSFLFVLPPVVVRALGGGWSGQPAAARWIAILLFALGGSLGLTSAWYLVSRGQGTPLPLDATRRLVTVGPYGAVRNPMAVAGVVQGIAVSVWHGSLLLAAAFVTGGLIWHVAVRPFEERDLAAAFGEEYREYRRHVPLWIPRR